MLRINKDVEYALICLIAMGNDQRVLSARELSTKFQIPYGLLCKILYRLAHGNIITSAQGPKGGYRLTGSMAGITIGRIMETVHGPTRVAACLDEDGACVQECNCNIKGIVRKVQDQWDLFVNSMTLAQFAEMDTPDEAPGRLSTVMITQ